MQYCPRCKVKVITKTDMCPLCHQKLKGDSKAVFTFPPYEPLKDKYTKSAIIISSVAPFLIAISILLNIFFIHGSYWSVVAGVGIVYFWLLGLLTFNRKVHFPIKLIAHAITISLVLIIINMFATSDGLISRITWAISYAIPFLIFGFILLVNIIMNRSKHDIKEFLLYQLALCILGFVPLIILAWGVAKPLYPSVITAFYSYSTIIYLIIYSKSIIKEEFKKKFHI
jgi:hypothetical protein